MWINCEQKVTWAPCDEQRMLAELYENRKVIERYAKQLGEEAPAMEFWTPNDGKQALGNSITPSGIARGKKVEVRPTEFFRKPLAEATRTYLERVPDNAAPFPEIIAALKQGGFEMRNGDAEEQRFRLNLLKSTNFVLIPENTFGLASVYAKRKGEKRGRKPNTEKATKKQGRQKKEAEGEAEA